MRLQPLRCLRALAFLALLLVVSVVPVPAQLPPPQPPFLPVDYELRGAGRNYDDICFWEDPTDPESSLAFIASKEGPVVEVFRLTTGELLESIPGFVKPNNCDVGGNLLVSTDSDGGKVLVHSIPDFDLLATFAAGLSAPEGVAILREEGRPFAAITDRSQNRVHIYDLVTLQFVRSFPTGFTANEGTAADELYQHILVSDGDSSRARVFSVTGTQLAEFGVGPIANDAEGLAIYRCGTKGWIVLSDQLENSGQATEFEIFDRVSFAHVGTFRMQNAAGDPTNATDGLDIFQVPTSLSASGILAACDDCNDADDDFDVIRWERIASQFGLEICPRGTPPTCGNAVVDPAWEECDGAADTVCPGQCQVDCTCAQPPFCGNTVLEPPAEECDRFDDAACPGACRPNCMCPGPGVCGDGILNPPLEACDGSDDAACPQACQVDCTCGTPPTGTVEADATVASDAANAAQGASAELALDANPNKRALLRIRVSDVGSRAIAAVRLHLQATSSSSAASDSGGRIRTMSSCTWNESTVTWNTQPAFGGTVLATAGAVGVNDTVALDITPAIAGDGVYCFAMDSVSTNGVVYRSREAAAGGPRVEIVLAPLTCGDGVVNDPREACDGADAAACPGACQSNCLCLTTTTTTTNTTTTTTTTLPTTTTTTVLTTTTTTTLAPTTTTTVLVTTTTTTLFPTTTSTTTSATTTTTTPPPAPPVGTVIADTHTEATSATTNFGGATVFSADADSAKHAFLRVQVTGAAGRAISSARLRLTADSNSRASSDSGGRIRAISNCTWTELGVTFNDEPALTGAVIQTLGAVARNQVVEFNLTSAIPGDGTYCFAIDSTSDDGVDYRSREASSGRPQLLLTLAAGTTTTTTLAPTTTTTTALPPTTTTTVTPPSTTTTTAAASTTTTTTTTAATTTTTLATPVTEILADTRTEIGSPNANFGTSTGLSADADSAKHTFMRVRVTGIGSRTVTRAAIQLRVPNANRAESDSGGRMHRAANCTWSETGVTFNNEPAMDAAVLSTVGPVARGALAEFDVTAAVPGDGTYCFAIDSQSDDGVDYNSREASTGRPVFVVTVAP